MIQLGSMTIDKMFDVDSAERSNTEIWLCSIISAGLVGLSGVLPLLLIPVETGKALKHGAPAARLRLLLSFAVGSLLGDVFLHLLPEAWLEAKLCGTNLGLWILVGILLFFIIEKLFADDNADSDTIEPNCTAAIVNTTLPDGGTTFMNGTVAPSRHRVVQNGTSKSSLTESKSSPGTSELHPVKSRIPARGYLNLVANVVDNFAHGLALGASFLVSRKVGYLTTFAILVHEVPHEVGDFAILLRSGFTRWGAAAAQLVTATGGVIGAITALSAGCLGDFTALILSFTSGGFIYIAMVTVMPDLLTEKNHRESFKQILGVCVGICVMGLVNGIV